MNGEKLIAFVDEIGAYFYDASTAMAHMKAGKWHNKFAAGIPFRINQKENLHPVISLQIMKI